MSASLIDFSPHRGVLIERAATDRDHERGVERFESYDPATNTVQEFVSVAEAEDLDLIDDETAASMRAQLVCRACRHLPATDAGMCSGCYDDDVAERRAAARAARRVA